MQNEKVFPSSKKIHVSTSSSLVDLKAELFKRKAELALQDKSSQSSSSSGSLQCPRKKPKWQVRANQLEAKGELNRIKPIRGFHSKNKNHSQRDQQIYSTCDSTSSSFQDEQLRKSRECLEAKAKLYDEKYKQAKEGITKFDSSDSDSDTDGKTLIDFRQKILLCKDEEKYKDKERIRSPSPISTVPLREDLDEDEDEDWVVFTDSLGRSRRCLKKDFEHFKQLDDEAKKSLSSRQKNDCEDDGVNFITQEEQNEIQQKNWEEIRPIAPVRYRQVIEDEVREHGVGFYMMSTDDEERKKQLDMLNSLRSQTAKQREIREKIKEKRKQAMNERLAKVAERKGIQLKVNSVHEEVEDEKEKELDEEEEEVERKKSIALYPSLVDDSIGMSKRDREALAMKELITREWDAGKRDESGRIVKSSTFTSSSSIKCHGTVNKDDDILSEARNEHFSSPSTSQSYITSEAEIVQSNLSSSKIEKDQFKCWQSTIKKSTNVKCKSNSYSESSQVNLLKSHLTKQNEDEDEDEDEVNCNDQLNELISEKLAYFREKKNN